MHRIAVSAGRRALTLAGKKGDWYPRRPGSGNGLGGDWFTGETVNIAIGQGYLLVTPIQLLNLISAVANGGILLKPQIAQRVEDLDKKVVEEYHIQEIGRLPISPENLALLRMGLVGVTQEEGGTGRGAHIEGIEVAGKTGTAQVVRIKDGLRHRAENMRYEFRDHAWFVAYVAADTPLAVVVLVEHGGHGAASCRPPGPRADQEVSYPETRSGMIDRRLWDQLDARLVTLTVALVVIGIVNLFSATINMGGEGIPLYARQLIWLGIGGVLALLVFAVDYRYYKEFAYPFYGLVLVAVLFVLVYGLVAGGGQRWIRVGFFFFQPSELMKIALILALARYFADHERSDGYRLRDLVIPTLITVVPVLLIMRQPDLGTAMVMVFILCSIILFVRIRLMSLLIVCLTILLDDPHVLAFSQGVSAHEDSHPL